MSDSVVIPFDAVDPNYTFRTVLDGVTYVLDVHWNDGDQAWYASLLDEQRDEIATSAKLVIGTKIFGRSTDARCPPGTITVVDLSGQDVDAGRNDLGTRVLVYYQPA